MLQNVPCTTRFAWLTNVGPDLKYSVRKLIMLYMSDHVAAKIFLYRSQKKF